MKNTKEVIGQYDPVRIVEARKSKGYSQEELAFNAGLSLRTIQRIEKGSVQPRLYSLKALAGALGCSVNEFKHASEVKSSQQEKIMSLMSLSVYSVLFLPFLPLLLQAIIWYCAKEMTEEENHRCYHYLHFQGRWLAGLVLTLLALPLITLLFTRQVSYGNFPMSAFIYLLFVGGNLAWTFLPERQQPHKQVMA